MGGKERPAHDIGNTKGACAIQMRRLLSQRGTSKSKGVPTIVGEERAGPELKTRLSHHHHHHGVRSSTNTHRLRLKLHPMAVHMMVRRYV